MCCLDAIIISLYSQVRISLYHQTLTLWKTPPKRKKMHKWMKSDENSWWRFDFCTDVASLWSMQCPLPSTPTEAINKGEGVINFSSGLLYGLLTRLIGVQIIPGMLLHHIWTHTHFLSHSNQSVVSLRRWRMIWTDFICWDSGGLNSLIIAQQTLCQGG